jgi:hypothetical protein
MLLFNGESIISNSVSSAEKTRSKEKEERGKERR